MDKIEILRSSLISNRARVGGYAALAKATGLSKSWVYKFAENKISEPRQKNLRILEAALESATNTEKVA